MNVENSLEYTRCVLNQEVKVIELSNILQYTSIYVRSTNKGKSINQFQTPWVETGGQMITSRGLKPFVGQQCKISVIEGWSHQRCFISFQRIALVDG